VTYLQLLREALGEYVEFHHNAEVNRTTTNLRPALAVWLAAHKPTCCWSWSVATCRHRVEAFILSKGKIARSCVAVAQYRQNLLAITQETRSAGAEICAHRSLASRPGDARSVPLEAGRARPDRPDRAQGWQRSLGARSGGISPRRRRRLPRKPGPRSVVADRLWMRTRAPRCWAKTGFIPTRPAIA